MTPRFRKTGSMLTTKTFKMQWPNEGRSANVLSVTDVQEPIIPRKQPAREEIYLKFLQFKKEKINEIESRLKLRH